MKFETGQTSEAASANISIVLRSSKRGPTMLRSFAQHIQQCCDGARALHPTYPHKYMRTRNKNGIGDGKRPRVLCFLILSPNMLRLVARVCTHRLTSRNKTQHCWAQRCCMLLRAFTLAVRVFFLLFLLFFGILSSHTHFFKKVVYLLATVERAFQISLTTSFFSNGCNTQVVLNEIK